MGTKERYGSEIPLSFSIVPSNLAGFVGPPAATLSITSRPHDLTFSRRKRFNRYQTRGGWVEEDWGDELARVTGEGLTDGFQHDICGYTRVPASETKAYKAFLDLVDLYRNNGYVYGSRGEVVEGIYDTYDQPVEHILFSYRESLYRGYFDSLTWTEDADQPHLFSWSFEFTIVKTVFGY